MEGSLIGWGGGLWKTPWRGSLKKTEVEGKGNLDYRKGTDRDLES